MALERLELSFPIFSIYLRLSMIESPQEMSNTQEYRRIAPVCSRFTTFLGLKTVTEGVALMT